MSSKGNFRTITEKQLPIIDNQYRPDNVDDEP